MQQKVVVLPVCHPNITQRINTSLMATLSGMISVDRYVFGEQNSPDLLTDIHHLGHSAADEHLRNLCVRCYLGNPKIHPGPVTEESRGGGCLACHLNYNKRTAKAITTYRNSNNDTTFLNFPPAFCSCYSAHHCFQGKKLHVVSQQSRGIRIWKR